MFSNVVVEISATVFALLPEDQNSSCESHDEVQSGDGSTNGCPAECFGCERTELTTNHRAKFLEEKLKVLNVNVVVMSENSSFSTSSLKVCGGWSEICAVRFWLMHFIQTTEQLEAGTRCEAVVNKHCTESPSDRPRRSLRNCHIAKQDRNAQAVPLSTVASSKPTKAKWLKQNKLQAKMSKVLLNTAAPASKRQNCGRSEYVLESLANGAITNDGTNINSTVAPVNILTDEHFAAQKSVTEEDGTASIQTFLVESASGKSGACTDLRQQPEEPLAVNKSAQKLTFRCDLCEYVTGKQRNLLMHEARKHGDRSYVCQTCNRTFAIGKDLNQHLKCHTEQYCCEHCGRTLKSKYALALHVARIHKGAALWPAKRYLCTVCGKMCRNKTDYNVHHNKEHTGVRPFHCDVCNAGFFSRSNLRAHRQVLFLMLWHFAFCKMAVIPSVSARHSEGPPFQRVRHFQPFPSVTTYD